MSEVCFAKGPERVSQHNFLSENTRWLACACAGTTPPPRGPLRNAVVQMVTARLWRNTTPKKGPILSREATGYTGHYRAEFRIYKQPPASPRCKCQPIVKATMSKNIWNQTGDVWSHAAPRMLSNAAFEVVTWPLGQLPGYHARIRLCSHPALHA